MEKRERTQFEKKKSVFFRDTFLRSTSLFCDFFRKRGRLLLLRGLFSKKKKMSAAVCPAPMQDNSGSNHRQDQRYFLPSSEDLPSLEAPLFSPALAAAFALPYGSMTAFGSDGMLAAVRARSSGGVGGSGVGSGGAATMPPPANAAGATNATVPTPTPTPGPDAAAAAQQQQHQQQAAHAQAQAQAAAAAAAAANPFAYNVYGGGPYGGPPTPYGGLYFDSSAAALGAFSSFFFPPRERELRALVFRGLLALLFPSPSPRSLGRDVLGGPEWESGGETGREWRVLTLLRGMTDRRSKALFSRSLALVDDLIERPPRSLFSLPLVLFFSLFFSLFSFLFSLFLKQATRPTAAGATRWRWRRSSRSPPRLRRGRSLPLPRHSSRLRPSSSSNARERSNSSSKPRRRLQLPLPPLAPTPARRRRRRRHGCRRPARWLFSSAKMSR